MHHSIVRRDPRKAQILRNRLHPLHASLLSEAGDVFGSSGLRRRNPHLHPHCKGFIGSNGIKRIDRSSLLTQGIQGAVAEAETANLPLHQVQNPQQYIVAVLDMAGGRIGHHDKDMLGLAQQMASQLTAQLDEECAVVAVVFGQHKEHRHENDNFVLSGVDRLVQFDDGQFEGYQPDNKLAALTLLAKALDPVHWLFPDSVNGGTELGSRLAARLKVNLAAQVWKADITECVSRAESQRKDIYRQTPSILLLLEEVAMPVDEIRHEARPLAFAEHEFGVTNPKIVDGGLLAVDPNDIAMAEAEFILSAGNGIHNWQQFHDVAKQLGATEGASRVAVDDGFMDRSRQVGATGTWVTARVYVAVGISGAIQHMQGIGQCDKIVAINTDASCDMVKRGDLSVIADSEEMLAEMARLLTESQTQDDAQGDEHAA